MDNFTNETELWNWSHAVDNTTSPFLHLANRNTSEIVHDDLLADDQVGKTMTVGDTIAILVIPPFFLIGGTFGNIISAIIMWRRPFRKHSAGIYLFFLAVADTVYLWSSYPSVLLFNALTGYLLSELSTWSCRIVTYIYFTSGYISSWMIVGMAVERAIIVALPHKARLYCSRKKAITYCCSICFVVCCFCTHIFFTIELNEVGCFWKDTDFTVEANKVKALTGHFVDFTMYSLIPFCIILVCNTIIMVKLKQSNAWRSTLSKDGGQDKTSRDNYRLAILLLSISFFFVITVTPTCFIGIVDVICIYGINSCPLTWYKNPAISTHVGNFLELLNHSANFLLYCLTGPAFREELVKILSCCQKGDDTMAPDQTPGSGRANNETRVSTISN